MNPQSEQRGLLTARFVGIVGALLVILLFVAYFFYGLQPVAATNGGTGVGAAVPFQIVRGEGFKEIAARLSNESLVRSISVFKIYAFLSGSAQKFQPGRYTLSNTMSVPDIVQTLTRGGVTETTVVIPEGATVKDIDTMLVAADVLATSSLESYPLGALAATYPFLANASSLEGFLFPDTYRFHLGATMDEVLATLLGTFEAKAWPLMQGGAKWYDTLTLASYLEREVPDETDRQIVAGIILRRLSLGMPLQIDATVSYAKCEGRFLTCPSVPIARSDLAIPSPYNTYARVGWTPTPIANPGLEAIRAALAPTTTPYLYYLSTPDGQTLFSKTLAEHNAKRAKYLLTN